MSDFVRLFIALNVPAAVLEQLARVVDSLRSHGPIYGLRFIPPESQHATLKFLGSVPRDRIAELSGVVADSAVGFAPIESSIESLSGFSDPRRARVLVALLSDPSRALAGLASGIERRTHALGFSAEARELKPHVTLARLREPRNLTRVLSSAPVPPAAFCFESLSLYRSEVTPGGSRYHALTTAKLAAIAAG